MLCSFSLSTAIFHALRFPLLSVYNHVPPSLPPSLLTPPCPSSSQPTCTWWVGLVPGRSIAAKTGCSEPWSVALTSPPSSYPYQTSHHPSPDDSRLTSPNTPPTTIPPPCPPPPPLLSHPPNNPPLIRSSSPRVALKPCRPTHRLSPTLLSYSILLLCCLFYSQLPITPSRAFEHRRFGLYARISIHHPLNLSLSI
jgi:hypothetical protein